MDMSAVRPKAAASESSSGTVGACAYRARLGAVRLLRYRSRVEAWRCHIPESSNAERHANEARPHAVSPSGMSQCSPGN
jgi:hypothetical protein